jgi:hypothetical protein
VRAIAFAAAAGSAGAGTLISRHSFDRSEQWADVRACPRQCGHARGMHQSSARPTG